MTRDGPLHDSDYWHKRSEEARARADEMHDANAKTTMLSLSAMYQRMAQRAAERESEEK
jgi:hypothetical protein